MSVTPDTLRPRPRGSDNAPLLRRKSIAPVRPRSPIWRRALNYLLVFGTAVLLADALVGERGLVATTRARRQSDELTATVLQLRSENARLHATADRLRTDPSTIESLARETLGLIRPGEVLVMVKDVLPATK
jgi:cell division protein FtsB